MEHEIRTANEFRDALAVSGSRLIHVRPRVMLELAERNVAASTRMSLPIPSSGIGSVTMLEATMMVTILRLFNPSVIVEFGTFLGYSTALFLSNTESSSVISVDLPSSAVDPYSSVSVSDLELRNDGAKNDEYLRRQQRKSGHVYLSGLPTEQQERLVLIKSDSRSLLPADLTHSGKPDMIFIDGGHDEDIVKSDSHLAMETVAGDGVILWHDFGSNTHHGVTRFLENWEQAPQLVAIGGTLLAVAFLGANEEALKSLVDGSAATHDP